MSLWQICPLLLLVTAAGITDIHARRIPNWLTLCGALAGFWLGGWRFAWLGFALGFGFYLCLYLVDAVGAGDVKLMGAVGALSGWFVCLEILAVTAFLGVLAALAAGKWPGLAKRGIPHGAVIALAVVLLWISGFWLGRRLADPDFFFGTP